jgi:hypothetical protein
MVYLMIPTVAKTIQQLMILLNNERIENNMEESSHGTI